MRQFPFDFDLTKEISFYPSKPTNFNHSVLEIGPGRGDLLIALAMEFQQTKFVAIELGKLRYQKLTERLAKKILQMYY